MGGRQLPVDQNGERSCGLSLEQHRKLASRRRRTGTEAEFEGVMGEVQIQGMGGESGRELADYVDRTGRPRGRRTNGQGKGLDIRLPEVVGVRVVGYVHLPVRQ